MTSPKILKIDQHHPEEALIHAATQILIEGGIVVAPTETRYGLVGRIDIDDVVAKLYRLKRRVTDMPSAVFVRSHKEISRFGYENDVSRKLSEDFLPGPLTLVLRNKSGYQSPIVVSNKIGIRYSSSSVITMLLENLEFNVTATSANISTGRETETIEEIAELFNTEVDLYLDSGRLNAVPSTVVDCSGAKYRILRTGSISEEKIIRSIMEIGGKDV